MRLAPFLAASSLLFATSLASARDCAYWSGNGPSVYGLQNGLTEQYAGAVDQAGLGGLRLDFRIDTESTWDAALFAQYDASMAVAKEHGLAVTGIVLYESTTGSQTDWNAGYDATGMSPYVQSFVDTAKMLMDRYGDQVKTWEIWNEPNAWTNGSYATDPTTAGGTYIVPIVYAKMLSEVFVQANATITSKGLHLVTGGLFAHDIGGSFSPATDYMKEVYDQGPWDWMQANYGRRYPWDGFGYHVYVDQGGPTSSQHLGQYLDAVTALEAQENDASPLWITEFGWQAPSAVSLGQQASNLDTALQLFESRSDVARTFVFKVDDYDDWGIFDGTWAGKPAVATYQAHTAGCTHAPGVPLDAGAGGGGNDGGGSADAGAGSSEDAGAGAGADGGTGAGADAGADAGVGARADAGAGAGADAGAGGNGASGGGSAPGGPASGGGCGCVVAGSRDTGFAPGALALLLAALGLRRGPRPSRRGARPSRRGPRPSGRGARP